MNEIYPYSSPIILTDDIFQKYNGNINASTPELRQIAFTVAEEKVSEDISTFLLPTTVTGTFSFEHTRPIITDYAYVNQVNVVRFLK